MRHLITIAVLLLLAAVAYVSGPYRLSATITNAIETQNLSKLESRINFLSIREQLTAKMMEGSVVNGTVDPISLLLAAKILSEFVDSVVTPAVLIAFSNQAEKNSSEPTEAPKIKWISLTQAQMCSQGKCFVTISPVSLSRWQVDGLTPEVLENMDEAIRKDTE